MKITFHPQRRDEELHLAKSGETLFINGEAFDFSDVPEGGLLPASAIKSPFIGGPVTRKDGVIDVHILMPHSAKANDVCRLSRRVLVTRDGEIKLRNRGAG